MECEVKSGECKIKLYSVECGVGVENVEWGLWSVKCRVWSVKFGVESGV